MHGKTILFVASVLLLPAQAAYSEESDNSAELSVSDSRQLISMPNETRKLMREDMMNNLSALNEIFAHLTENNFNDAAEVAENRMGKSSMGKHRSTGMGPGRFMPIEMRNIGWTMHEAASEFAVIAKQGDLTNAYNALQKVTSACVACHYGYRTQ